MNISIKQPSSLVSVYIPVKNSIESIQRCIKSVISQDYANIEVIVQDGASSDGTLELLYEYANHIQLVSEPDSGPAEGLVKALKRCKGEYVIACLSDEELLPGAISWAVDQFHCNPSVAVIYGDIITTDISGNTVNTSHSKQWNYDKVFCSEYFPYFCASFFKRECIEIVGLPADPDAAEFGLWWRIGLHFNIKYISHLVAKFALHDNQLSENIERYSVHLPGRLAEIDYITTQPNCNTKIKRLRGKAIAGSFLFNAERLVVRRSVALELAYNQYLLAQQYKPDLYRLAKLSLVLRQEGYSSQNQLADFTKIAFSILEKTLILKSTILDYINYMRIYSIQSIAMFGAWPGARPLIKKYEKWNVNVQFFVDNSKAKQGTRYLDRPVFEVEYLLSDAAKNIQAVIIASDESRDKMIGQLKNLGFDKKII